MRLGAVLTLGMLLTAFAARAEQGPLTLAPTEGDAREVLQDLFDKARTQDRPVQLPPGVFRFDDVLRIEGIKVSGAGPQTILQGTQPDRSAVMLTGKGAALSDLAVRFEATKRSSADESALVFVNEAEAFEVRGLSLSGGNSAGIFVRESGPGVVADNKIAETLADGIHITARSHDIKVTGNQIARTGDDGIAVVSYRKNKGVSRNIDIVDNRVIDNLYGRGLAVIGGTQVRLSGNEVRCQQGWAGILLASESAFQTFGVQGVAVIGNKVENCGGPRTGHGAIMLSRDNADNDGVWIESNYIVGSPGAALVIEGQSNRGVIVKDNGFSGFADGPIVFRQPQDGVLLSGNNNQPPAWARKSIMQKWKDKRP